MLSHSQFKIWLVIAEKTRATRWRRTLARVGWPIVVLNKPATLAAEFASAFGVALIDIAALGPRPGPVMAALKSKAPAVPVLIISAANDSDPSLPAILTAGADDCLFDAMDERLVLAKLNAHLRRLLPQLTKMLDVLLAPSGDIRLERVNHSVWLKGDDGVWTAAPALTPTETKLLSLFIESPGTLLDRGFLLESVWQDKATVVLSGIVDKHIQSLRRKLGPKGKRIQTVYGAGYIFRRDAR